MTDTRRDHDLPAVARRLGWRYHHIGIPHADAREGERSLTRLGVHVRGFDTSPYGIEWMRFEPGCQVPDIVRNVPHVAFVVDDLDAALGGREILIPPNSPSPGVRVAFIVDDGAPIELLEFDEVPRPPANRGQRTAKRGARGVRLTGGRMSKDRVRPSKTIRKARTIDEYLAALPEDKRAALEKLRRDIRAAAPDAVECISYGMPAFRREGRMLVWFGAASRHCAFYPGARPIAVCREDLDGYDTSKGTIRFAPGRPLPAALVRKLVKVRIKEE